MPSESITPSLGPSDMPTIVPSGQPSDTIIDDKDELLAAISQWIVSRSSIYGPVESWDVSRVDNFDSLFAGSNFNDDISNW